MPALANIVINDGATTPVAHTFAPDGIDGTVANYADRSGGLPIGYPKLTVSVRKPLNLSTGVYKVGVRIFTPTLEVTSASTGTGIQPAPTVSYTQSCFMEFLLPARGTLQNRKDIIAFAKNALANATINTVVENCEAVY